MNAPSPLPFGAVLYAKDMARVADFYALVVGLPVAESGTDLVRLGHEPGALLIQIPPHIAATFTIASPPERREDAAVKLSFRVADLAAARAKAARHGGGLDDATHEWEWAGDRICNAYDPEGNVLALHAPAPGSSAS